jgi:hypothetical protein
MTRATTQRTHPLAPKHTTAPTAIGLDVGYGEVKLVTGEGRLCYASLVAQLERRAQIAEHDPEVVTLHGTAYLTGEGVVSHGQRLRDHEGLDEWWEAEAYRALVARARRAIPPASHVVACLPARAFSAEAVARVRTVLQALLEAQAVDVLAQGTAAAMGYYLRAGHQPETGETTGVIDVGSRTTEVVGLDGRRPVYPRTTGLLLGLSRVWELVATRAGEELGRIVDPREVALAVRRQRPLRARGRLVPIESLRAAVQTAATALAADLIAEVERVWPPEFPETVLLAGGGAYYLADPLRQWRPDLVVVAEPEWANAVGCYLYGCVRLGLPPTWPAQDRAGLEGDPAGAGTDQSTEGA